MTAITYHAEVADGVFCVWAESDDIPGFSAAADGLEGARQLVWEFLEAEGLTDSVIERLSDKTDAGLHLWFVGGDDVFLTAMSAPRPPRQPIRCEEIHVLSSAG
ncbi:MAG: hypothetical protein Q7V88_09190 [Actinomycetota bacterium]|nr:hypothetical protein [Actinomycetota bacterium]